MHETNDVVIGVVSDTHIPDRVRDLHPDIIAGLKREGVQLILHAGDISCGQILEQLARVAPVRAVRGNRDFITLPHLPAEEEFSIHGVRIYLAHGHGSWSHYLWDKYIYMLRGYEFERYQRYLTKVSRGADVIVYGHTHRPEIRNQGRTLFINPGSAGPNYEQRQPSFGTLHIGEDGRVEGKIHLLEDYAVLRHRWRQE